MENPPPFSSSSTRIPPSGPFLSILGEAGAAVPNVAALRLLDASKFANGTTMNVGVINDSYRLIRGASAALLAQASATSVDVVAALNVVGAVWVRLFERNVPAQYETEWFIHAGGDDAANGNTLGTALRTVGELCNRLRGARIGQNVNVLLGSGSFPGELLLDDLEVAAGFVLTIRGNVTSVDDVLAAAVGTTAGAAATNAGAVRGLLTATAASFTAKQRLRCTEAGAKFGALTWVNRVTVAGVGGQANVGRWAVMDPGVDAIVTVVVPVATDTFALDTLDTTIGAPKIKLRGSGKVVLRDLNIEPAALDGIECSGVVAFGVVMYGCSIAGASGVSVEGGGWSAVCCGFTALATTWTNVSLATQACSWLGSVLAISANAQVSVVAGGMVLAGTRIATGIDAAFQMGTSTPNDLQVVDLTDDYAIQIDNGSTFVARDAAQNLVWGLNNTLAVAAIFVRGLFRYAAKPSIPGGLVDTDVGGHTDTYANLPRIVTTTPATTAADPGAGATMAP